MENNKVEVTVNMPKTAIAQLQMIAEKRGISPSEALSQIIAEHAFLTNQVSQGRKLLLENPGGTLQQVKIK